MTVAKRIEKHIRGREATYVAIENDKRRPIALEPTPTGTTLPTSEATVPATLESGATSRTAPPRVRKPLRGVFGMMSEEFSQTMFGKLVALLRPHALEHLDEATLNAGIALVASLRPRTEAEALLAVEIVGTGFAGQKFLRQSQQHLDENYINVYGNFGIKLLRLQLDQMKTYERLQRGSKQTVEVRHVHIHAGAQGVVGIVNAPEKREGRSEK